MTRGDDGGGVLAGHEGAYFGWTSSAAMDDATGTTVAVTANLMSLRLPAARVVRAVRDVLQPAT